MSNKLKWLLGLLLVFSIVVVAQAALQEIYYLPIVYRQNTPTPSPTITVTPTVTRTPTVTITPTRTPTPVPLPDIRIEDYEPDPIDPLEEWVEFKNYDNETIDMTDWRIRDEGTHRFYFPDNFQLSAGARVKVWTGSGTNDASNLYWGLDEEVWNNFGDCIYLHLLDEHNDYVLVDSLCYGLSSYYLP